MPSIDHWKISSKILVVLVVLCAAFISCTTFTTLQLKAVSGRYRVLIERDGPAAVEVATAAAAGLKGEANELSRLIAAFRVSGDSKGADVRLAAA